METAASQVCILSSSTKAFRCDEIRLVCLGDFSSTLNMIRCQWDRRRSCAPKAVATSMETKRERIWCIQNWNIKKIYKNHFLILWTNRTFLVVLRGQTSTFRLIYNSVFDSIYTGAHAIKKTQMLRYDLKHDGAAFVRTCPRWRTNKFLISSLAFDIKQTFFFLPFHCRSVRRELYIFCFFGRCHWRTMPVVFRVIWKCQKTTLPYGRGRQFIHFFLFCLFRNEWCARPVPFEYGKFWETRKEVKNRPELDNNSSPETGKFHRWWQSDLGK